MGFEHARPGLGNVGSYQVSGVPWVSSSLIIPAVNSSSLQISFQSVTSYIVVRNDDSGSAIRVGFSAAGVSGSNKNNFVLAPNESFAANFRVSNMYLISNTTASSVATVIAGLTGIEASALSTNWSGSAGIG